MSAAWFVQRMDISSAVQGGVALVAALALSLLLFLPPPADAQETGTVVGTVTDGSTLAPVHGAQVYVPGTSLGTLTDQDGRFRLTGVPARTVTVQVRSIGYRMASREVTVAAGQTATLEVQLAVSAVRLDDVVVNVVTGLERRRLQLGANVSDIDVQEVNKAAVASMKNVLAGRSEGVILQEVSGTVGTSQKIRIRGANSLTLSNEPLIFVDGIQVSNDKELVAGFTGGQNPSRLDDLNPEEIESIELVKGPAAAALYGAVGANGVILITTRRGRPGIARWHAYAEGSLVDDRNAYPANFLAAQVIGDPDAPLFTEAGFNFDDYAGCPNFLAAEGACTQDVFQSFNTLRDPRTTPFEQGDRRRYGLNVSGGGDVLGYFLSGELEREQGVIDYNRQDRASLRSNLSIGIRDNLRSDLSVGYTKRDVTLPNNDNSIFSPIINGLIGTGGFVPGEGPKGGPNTANYGFFFNQGMLREAVTNQEVDRFTGSLTTNWQPLSWLRANGTFGLDLVSRFDFITLQPGELPIAFSFAQGFRDAARTNQSNWTARASATAEFDLSNRVTSSSTAGLSYQEELIEGVICFGSGLIRGTSSCTSTSILFEVEEDFLNVKTAGAFFQQELGLDDRLFLSGSVRIDDDSNFGGESPVQAYPSANISYLISETPWFPTGSFLSDLRLRAAVGWAGLRPSFRDAITLLQPIAATLEGLDISAVSLAETGNPFLKPERVREFEAGFDAGLVEDRLSVQFTYFNRRSTDALVRRRLAPSLGLTTTLFENLGSVRNQGTELSLSARALEGRSVEASFLAQWTTISNKVLSLGEGVEPIIFNRGQQRHQPGFPAGAYFQPEISWDDADGNGLLSIDEVMVGEESVFLGNSLPTWTASLGADIGLFEFVQVRSLLDARGGHHQLNESERFRCQTGVARGSDRGCLATGGPGAPLDEQARFIAERFYGSRAGYVEKADFLKWRELSVTFSAPPSMARAGSILDRSSLTFAGRNLATITSYGGLDPEINETGGALLESGDLFQAELSSQPPVRIFTARLDVRF